MSDTNIQHSAPAKAPAKMASAASIGRFITLRTIIAMILREMSSTYGRSPGGYIWAIAEPAAGIVLITTVFTLAGFRTPPIGTNFAIYYATGILPFMLYADVSGKIAQSLKFSKMLLAYPRVTFMDALLARFALNFSTQVMVFYVLISIILVLYETRTSLDFGKISLAFAMAGALAFGIGVVNCYLTTRYQVWSRVWSITNRPMFLLSCILFLFESVPEPYASYLWYNPVAHITGQMRSAFYPYYNPTYISPAYVFGLSAALTVLGLIMLKKYHKDILNR
ncbi:MAG: ABC transporter permease [Paracoccaceae bacterium]|nr:ABC transporter permease [Paracoccaceae bacterium]